MNRIELYPDLLSWMDSLLLSCSGSNEPLCHPWTVLVSLETMWLWLPGFHMSAGCSLLHDQLSFLHYTKHSFPLGLSVKFCASIYLRMSRQSGWNQNIMKLNIFGFIQNVKPWSQLGLRNQTNQSRITHSYSIIWKTHFSCDAIVCKMSSKMLSNLLTNDL